MVKREKDNETYREKSVHSGRSGWVNEQGMECNEEHGKRSRKRSEEGGWEEQGGAEMSKVGREGGREGGPREGGESFGRGGACPSSGLSWVLDSLSGIFWLGLEWWTVERW